MPRHVPDCEAKPTPKPPPRRDFSIKLITPMFGGGVETRVNDASFPIRPTSIRGQLQFWWRATAGAQYETLADLRKAQSAVWGDTAEKSPVQVLVTDQAASSTIPCATYREKGDGKFRLDWDPIFREHEEVTYALFPFQGSAKGGAVIEEPSHCITKASFKLTLLLNDSLWPQVETALWAWVNFGGLGGRTRRGCGSLFCAELAPRNGDQLAEQLKRFLPARFDVRDWPTIADAVMVGQKPVNPIEASSRAIGLLRHFRQGEEFGRSKGRQGNLPGRSRFPEPETIRRVTKQRMRGHDRQSSIPDDAFPRAEFGLPIVFHFKDEKDGDPKDTTLYPSKGAGGQVRDRMASPLILKPLAMSDGSAIPLIMRLRTPPLEGVELRGGKGSLQLPPKTAIRDPRLSTYPNSPLAGSPSGSALEAFLAYARENGFEVPKP